MRLFKFEIKELLSKTVEVKANKENEAYFKVKEMYQKEKIVLDSSNYVDTDIIKSQK